MKKNLVIIFTSIGVLCLIALIYINSAFRSKTRVFSSYSLLTSTWEKYKAAFINNDGRVIDYAQNSITTSEGQSYALLRAVWSDDKSTFDLVWQWTKNNLRRSDNLFAWKWGQKEDGSYGILSNGGENSATDSDSDIALALIFASSRWQDPSYQAEAKLILESLWDRDTIEINNQRYFLPGEWANTPTEIILNPSYFSPYAWRIFAQIDTSHNWESLITPAYDVLNQAGYLNLRNQSGVGLPPNWISLDKATHQLKEPPAEFSIDYSYDAMRIPWRVAVDYAWYSDERAISYLNKLSRLKDIYQINHQLMSEYSYDGNPLTNYENPSFYSTSLAYFQNVHPDLALEIYNNKILTLYSNDTNSFKPELGYYDQNWVWFGIALYTNNLPNLHNPIST
jgi:endoglucanase